MNSAGQWPSEPDLSNPALTLLVKWWLHYLWIRVVVEACKRVVVIARALIILVRGDVRIRCRKEEIQLMHLIHMKLNMHRNSWGELKNNNSIQWQEKVCEPIGIGCFSALTSHEMSSDLHQSWSLSISTEISGSNESVMQSVCVPSHGSIFTLFAVTKSAINPSQWQINKSKHESLLFATEVAE